MPRGKGFPRREGFAPGLANREKVVLATGVPGRLARGAPGVRSRPAGSRGPAWRRPAVTGVAGGI